MEMWSSQLYFQFKQLQILAQNFFQGFNGIRTHGLCVSAALLYQLWAMKTHMLDQFIEFIFTREIARKKRQINNNFWPHMAEEDCSHCAFPDLWDNQICV